MILVSDRQEKYMNFEILKEEAAALQLISSELGNILKSLTAGDGQSHLSERLMRDIQRIEQLSELVMKYADDGEKTEYDICSFMRQKLFFRDPESSLGDIIIEKDIKISDSAAISGKTLIHDRRTENAAFACLATGYGDTDEQ